MIITKFKRGVLYNGDCLKVLPKKVETGSVDLVFADPPFNIGYKYDQYKDKISENDYKMWSKHWIYQCDRVLKPNGSIFVAIGDDYAAQIKIILDEFFTLRNWIIWTYNFGVYCKGKFGRNHTHILYYVKNSRSFTFNDGAIREPSLRQTTVYRDNRAEANGRVPGDVWSFPRVCGTFKERTGHPCQMPESVLERIIRVATVPGNVILDPFSGSGTSLAVSKRLGRKFVGVELSSAYCKLIKRRLRAISH